MDQIFLILAIITGLIILHIFDSTFYDNLIEKYLVRKEGFEDMEEIPGIVDESSGIVRWMDSVELYDTFYAGIYDKLTQGAVRTQAEVGLIMNEWTKSGDDPKTFEILDAGCGTGIAVAAFSKMGVKRVTGMDNSAAMLKQAEKTISVTTLDEEQKKAISWRNDDIMNASAYKGGEFTHATMLYFTIYYFPDKETVFRNLFFCIRPGGKLVVQVVNKNKFDPMLESSTPWIGFSLQKYSDTRVKKSEVVFNKFKYTGEFDLQDPEAEFRETFRFKDKVRRQRHTFRMEDMNYIVSLATKVGWEYVGHVDLAMVGCEYMYHLHFNHK